MRAFFYTLLVVFASAVIAPHASIGTHDLPATGVKALEKVAGHDWHKPRGHGQFALVALDEFGLQPPLNFSDKIMWLSMRTVAKSQLSSPLLI